MLSLAFALAMVFSSTAEPRKRGTRSTSPAPRSGTSTRISKRSRRRAAAASIFGVRIDINREIKRGQDDSLIKLQYGTIETHEGQVLRLDTRTQAGGDPGHRGPWRRHRGKMKLELDGAGRSSQELTIPWGRMSAGRTPRAEHGQEAHEGTRGPAAQDVHARAEQGLRHRASCPHIRVHAAGRRLAHTLLRVDQTTKIGGKRMPEYDVTCGSTRRQVLKGGKRTFSAAWSCTGRPGSGPFRWRPDQVRPDQGHKDQGRSKNPRTRRRLHRSSTGYLEERRLGPDFPAGVAPDGHARRLSHRTRHPGGQDCGATRRRARSGGCRLAVLEAQRAGHEPGSTGSNLARQVTRGVNDPWEKAGAHQPLGLQDVQDKNFTVAFATAGEVARN